MSRDSHAKKARRKKRKAARQSWVPNEVVGALDTSGLDDHAAELLAAAEKFDEFLVSRGWTFDEANTAEGLASWFYEPSAVDDDGEGEAEPVTRVWFTVTGDDDDFPHAVHAVLAGSVQEDGFFTISPDLLVQRVAELEAYRPGDPEPLIS